LARVLSNVTTIVIWGAAFLAMAQVFGVNVWPLLASAGIVSIAIAFGAQDLVKDMISGLFMMVEDQYGVGDVIDVGEASGTVEDISIRTTRIRDDNGTLWHVPNGEIRRVGNMSQDWSRALLDIPLSL
jgi:small conductance mechanosensitive channel